MPGEDIYQPSFVAKLFDEMSATYGFVNVVSSFGFCVLWRWQCIRHLRWRPGLRVYDLMSGMGELWPTTVRRLTPGGEIIGLDISGAMCQGAQSNARAAQRAGIPIQVIQADVLQNDLPDQSADAIICCFGLKTFSNDQQRDLAQQVRRLLRPGGQFSFLGISVPTSRLLRMPYLFYLSKLIPLIGRLCLGNPDNYRMLSIYTQAFNNAAKFATHLTNAGLTVTQHKHFFGCATAVSGHLP